jgi:hypothetical protein
MSAATTDRAAIVLQQIDAALALAEKDGELLSELAADFESAHSFEDSYGVPGSEWAGCDICKAEDKPGIFAKGIPHEETCKVFRANRIIAASRTLMPKSLLCLKTAIEGLLIGIDTKNGRDFATTACENALATLCDQWQKDREQQAELDTLDYVADALDDAGDSQGCMEAAAKANEIRLRMEGNP